MLGGMVLVMLLLAKAVIILLNKSGNLLQLLVSPTQKMLTDGSMSLRAINQKEIFQINSRVWFHHVLVTMPPVTKVNIVTVTFIHVSSNLALTQIAGATHTTLS